METFDTTYTQENEIELARARGFATIDEYYADQYAQSIAMQESEHAVPLLMAA